MAESDSNVTNRLSVSEASSEARITILEKTIDELTLEITALKRDIEFLEDVYKDLRM